MEIKVTVELGEKTVELIKRYFPLKEETPPREVHTIEDTDDEALKLDMIIIETKAIVKQGCAQDVKRILNQFGAARVSSLLPADYNEFYNMLIKLKA